MAANGLQRTLDRLRIVLAPDLPDEHLLKKFISSRDEVAFATLVRRHGKMVMDVSRRIVGNLHDSEDVVQATFLVLAQKARLVVNRYALASWLYKVAYRISLKARARNGRRRQMETQVDVMPHTPSASPELRDWEALLDEELNRLPEKYRLPVILCDLEGRSRKEVEQQLKLAAGTLSSRLTRARQMLAERLTRRGVVLSGGALWAASSQATASLPPKLVAATAHKAVLVAAGQLGTISSSVNILMKAGVKAMFISKLKAAVATVVVLASLGAASLVYSGGGGAQTGPAKPQSELEKLRKEIELLRVNLRVTLEKIQVLENELRAFKGPVNAVNNRQGGGGQYKPPTSQPPTDKSGSTSESTIETARFPRDRDVERPGPVNAKKGHAYGGLQNANKALEELNRAFSTLGDPKASGRQESLRRAVQTLEQLLKQLRDVEDNRSDVKR